MLFNRLEEANNADKAIFNGYDPLELEGRI